MSSPPSAPARVLVQVRAPLARAVAVAASVMLTWQVSTLLTRSDNKSEIGAWSVIFTAMFAVGTVTRFGLDTLALRVLATTPSRGRATASASLALVFLLSVPGGAALAWLTYSRQGVSILDERAAIAVTVGAVVLALNLTVMAGAWLRALGYVASGALLELGAAPIMTILALGVYAQFELIDLAHVVGTYAVSAWVAAVGMMAWAGAELRKVPSSEQRWSAYAFWSKHRGQLAAFMVTGLGFFLFSYLAILVFGAVGDDASAADYRNCFTLAGLVSLVPTMQASYLTPRFAELFHRGELGQLRRLVRRATRAAMALGFVLALPLLLVPGTVLGVVFGDPYVHAAPMLRILALAALLLVACGPVYPLLTMTGLEGPASRIIPAVVAAGVGLMFLAYQVGGPVVVTAASVLPSLAFALLGHLRLRRLGVESALWVLPAAAGRGPRP